MRTTMSGVEIIVPRATEHRLIRTCFRGSDKVAGNFCFWNSVIDVLSNVLVRAEVIADLSEPEMGRHSLEVDYGSSVGWSNTDVLDKFHPTWLETFKPNKRSTGLKVKLTCPADAPLTNFLTIVYEYKLDPGPTAIIHSMYPGQDIGDLKGDVSERENCVFFDWYHPGEEKENAYSTNS